MEILSIRFGSIELQTHLRVHFLLTACSGITNNNLGNLSSIDIFELSPALQTHNSACPIFPPSVKSFTFAEKAIRQ
jgi:hypothetical protein